jgi:hypothetical protein
VRSFAATYLKTNFKTSKKSNKMNFTKKLLAALLLTGTVLGACKKASLTEMGAPEQEAEATTNRAAVASTYRVLVNGVNLAKGVTGYQAPLIDGSTVLVDAGAWFRRINYTEFNYPTTKELSGVVNAGNNAPAASIRLQFTNGSSTVLVQPRGSSVSSPVTMPVPAVYTAAGRMMVPAKWLAQYTGIPVDLVEEDAATQSLQFYFYEECDYGLYFIGRQDVATPDAVGSQKYDAAGGTNPFFSSAKPTIIYVHGWQPNAVNKLNSANNKRYTREQLLLNQGGLNVHAQNAFIDAGWNVAIFHWIQLADDDYGDLGNKPDTVEAKMYNPNFAGIGMRWKRTDGQFVTSTTVTPKKSVAGLLADEINKIRAANPNVELRIVGNSLGGNLTMAAISPSITTLPTIAGFPNTVVSKLPERVALMDPYWCRSDLVSGSIVNNLAFGESSGLNFYNANKSIEYWRTSLLGQNGFNKGLARYCAYLNFIPGYAGTFDLGSKHTMPVRQYFHSFGMTNSAVPLERLETGLFSNQRAMSAQTTNARILDMMRQTAYWDHEAASGSTTATLQDDVYKRVLGDPQ